MSNAIVFDIRGNPASFKNAIAQSVSSLSRFKTGISGIAGTMKSLVSGFMAVNTQIIGFRGAMQSIDFIKDSVKEFSNFEHGMKQIKAVSGASSAELGQIGKIIEDVGMKTQFSVQDIQKGVFNLGTMGVKGTENFKMLTPAIANAAVSLDVDFNRAAEVVLSTLKQFNMPMKDASKVADILTGAYTNSRLNMDMFAVSSQYAGLAAKAFGKGLDDVLPLLMSLSDQGIDASISGTQIRTGFLKLIKPTSEARRELKKFGLSMKDVDANKLSFIDVLANIEKSGMKMKSMVSVFGVRAAPVFDALINAKNVDTGKKGVAILRDYQNATNQVGLSAKHAEERQKGLHFTFTVLDASMSVLKMKFGELLQNYFDIDGAIKSVSDSIVRMTEIIAKVDIKALKTVGINIFDVKEISKNLIALMPTATDLFVTAAMYGATSFLIVMAKNLPIIMDTGGQLLILAMGKAANLLVSAMIDMTVLMSNAFTNITANIKDSMADMIEAVPGMGGLSKAMKSSANQDRLMVQTMKNAPWIEEMKSGVDLLFNVGSKEAAKGWSEAVKTFDAVTDISQEMTKSLQEMAKKNKWNITGIDEKFSDFTEQLSKTFDSRKGKGLKKKNSVGAISLEELFMIDVATKKSSPPIGGYTSPSEMTGLLAGGGKYGMSQIPDRGLFRNVTRTTSEQEKILQEFLQKKQNMQISEQAASSGYKAGGATYIKIENNQDQIITNFNAKSRKDQMRPLKTTANPFGDRNGGN